MKKKIAIVSVPFLLSKNHFNIAKSTLLSLLGDKHNFDLRIITIANRLDISEEDIKWLQNISNDFEYNDRNILARAWNIGINKALLWKADFILVINLDIFFHQDFLQNIITFAEQNPEPILWGGTIHNTNSLVDGAVIEKSSKNGVHFSCFLCDHRLFKEVGEFDETFVPAYHEDSDMLYRISLAGHSTLSTSLAIYKHIERGTLKGAAEAGQHEFILELNKHLESSLQHYCDKWGGPPDNEKYKKPYGSS